MRTSQLIACHDCDLIQRRLALASGEAALCRRCGAVLYRERGDSLPRALAWALAACIAFVIANAFPVFTLSTAGVTTSTTLLDALRAMWLPGMEALSLLICYAALVSPGLFLALTAYALARVLAGGNLGHSAVLLRFLGAVRPWAMVEVLMLGVLVAAIKISAYASVEPGIGLWAFAATVVLQTLLVTTLETEDLWRRFAAPDAAPQPEAIP